jgi:hypothetical protein
LQQIIDPEGILKRFIALSQTIKPKDFGFVLLKARFILLRQFDANELENDFSQKRSHIMENCNKPKQTKVKNPA